MILSNWPPEVRNLSMLKGELCTGIVHSATKSSVYSSLSIYDLWKLQGIMAVSDFELTGSVDVYLKGTKSKRCVPLQGYCSWGAMERGSGRTPKLF